MATSTSAINPRRGLLTPEILAEVRRLHLVSRRLADSGLSGGYKSAYRGQGIEFEEVREYVPGDDTRSIDWKVTARQRKPFIKSYREERELTVLLALDVSGSTFTGTRGRLREELIATVGAVLTFAAIRNNDRVGLATFADDIISYHPPRKQRGAAWRVVHEALAPREAGKGTNLANLFRFLSKVLKRRAVIFVLSDFFDSNFEKEMSLVSRKHDVTAVIARDPSDLTLPNAGLVRISDRESGELVLLDTSSDATCREYAKAVEGKRKELAALFRKNGVEMLELNSEQPVVKTLRQHFDRRTKKFGLGAVRAEQVQ
jgi:uncharacterized protein (DUF58 family)